MSDWAQSYTAKWRMVSVNPKTWGDDDDLVVLDSISLSKNATDSVPLLETATVKTTVGLGERVPSGWYRLQMDTTFSDGSIERVNLATLLFERTSGSINYNVDQQTLKGQSVLKPASDRLMIAGEFVPKGYDGARWVADHLGECVNAPIEVVGGFEVNEHYVFDDDTSYLKACWKLLDAAGWVIRIDGTGSIQIVEKPKNPSLVLDRANSNIVIPGIDYDEDYSKVPNRYYAIRGSRAAVAVNDDPDSPTSVVQKGRYIDYTDRDVIQVNGESLQQYANRKLEEASIVTVTHDYQREYWPDVVPMDLVRGQLANIFEGDMRVITQSFDTAHGIIVNETLGQEVSTWQA